MTHVLSAAGRAFLKAFAASILILAPGVLNAPNLNQSYLLGVAALFASIAAGLKVLVTYVPQLSFVSYVKAPYGSWLDSFLHAFLGAFVTSVIGILNAPDMSTWRAAATAALVGAVTAGLRAIQGLTTKGEYPAPATGLNPPPATPVVVPVTPVAR